MKKYIWLLLLALSGLGIYLSIIHFGKAIPILDIEINTDKNLILEKAKQISEKYSIGPKKFKEVIYFNSETNTQNYLELELKNQQAPQNLVKNKLYYPYTWQVRHFQQYNPNECVIKFTPDGKFYGFIEHISENELIPSLNEDQAKELIEEFLIKEADINLKDYTIVSSSCETRSNGRFDQTFIYQKNITADSLKYRIILTVCGNKITTFNHYIDIPEAFNRKFAQMETFGETISSFANMFMYIFYIFFGCILGLIYLIKQNWLVTKKSIAIGIILALAELIYKLNEIPLIWINYNTANSFYSHLLNHIIGDLALFSISIITYSSTVAVAEGLTRLAFDHHLQFFKLLKLKVLSSTKLIKKILISYLLIPLFIAFVLTFYSFGIGLLKWWSPSTLLVNPNILNTYFPGLSILAQSFKTSFWEECLFRAIPLAFFYIVSKRFKHKQIVMLFGLLLQAIVFSAAHANYLTIPSYVRIIELIIPSIGFGFLYLRFGLLPIILIHFAYDTFFLSMPILFSNNIILDKTIVIIGFLTPLIIPLITILIKRIFNNFKICNSNNSEIDDLDNFYNKNWQPRLSINSNHKSKYSEPELKSFSNNNVYCLFIISSIFFISSLFFTKLKPDLESISIDRTQAIDIATNFLKQKNINLDKSWSVLTSIYHPEEKELESKFIWQKDHELYKVLSELGYIQGPLFRTRFVKFESSDIDREQEYDIYISSNKEIVRYRHAIPYNNSGKYLFKDQAKSLAINFIADRFNLDKSNIEEVASKTLERCDRQDWEFIFKDKTLEIFDTKNLDVIKQIIVKVSGSEITDAYKNIFTPQDWLRNAEHNKQVYHIASLITGALFLFFIALSFIKFLNLFNDPNIKLSKAKLFLFIYSILVILKQILILPEAISNFSTSKPFLTQVISSELIALISSIAQIISITLLFTVTISYNYKKQIINSLNLKNIVALISALSFFILSMFIFLQYFIPLNKPIITGFSQLNSYYPKLLYIIENIITYLNNTVYFIFIAQLARYKFNLRSIIIFLLATATIVPLDIFYNINQWLILCLFQFCILFLVYMTVIRFDISLIPLIYNFIYQLNLIKNYIIQDYPSVDAANLSIIPTILTMLIISACCLVIIKILNNKIFTLSETITQTPLIANSQL